MAKTDKPVDTPETQAVVPSQPKLKALRVRALNNRFRRAGITFGQEDQVIPLAELTAEQIAQIKGEPLLAVTEIEIDA